MTAEKKAHRAFFPCFLAAFLLVWLSALNAVYLSAIKPSSFEKALLQTVDAERLGTDAKSLQAFANHTIAYLVGEEAVWSPQITLLGTTASTFIPMAFRAHMAEVRGWVQLAPPFFLTGAALVLLLLWLAVKRHRGKHGLCLGGYYAGVGAAFLLLAALGLWAVLDFNSLWGILHRVLIPDGIFSAGELVMQLFPITLFSAYLPNVVQTFALLCGLVLLLPLAVSHLVQAFARHKSPRP
ncbi:MAG: DUF1461 domain-containing protein [Clostridia bacterium]